RHNALRLPLSPEDCFVTSRHYSVRFHALQKTIRKSRSQSGYPVVVHSPLPPLIALPPVCLGLQGGGRACSPNSGPPVGPKVDSLGGGVFFGQPLTVNTTKKIPPTRQHNVFKFRIFPHFSFGCARLLQACRPRRTSIISPPTSQLFYTPAIFRGDT